MNINDVIEHMRYQDEVVTAYDLYVEACQTQGEVAILSFSDLIVVSVGRALFDLEQLLVHRVAMHDIGLPVQGGPIHTQLVAIGSMSFSYLIADTGIGEAYEQIRAKLNMEDQ